MANQVSEDLLQFKNGNPLKIQEWCSRAMREISGLISPTIIVRALGSAELKANSHKPLDQLGTCLAEYLNASYRPDLLIKSSSNLPLKGLGKAARERAIDGLYTACDLGEGVVQSILILDDIITTGSTLREIHRAIINTYPNTSVYFLALAKTQNSIFAGTTTSQPVTPAHPTPPSRPRVSRYDSERARRMGISDETLINIRSRHSNHGREWFRSDIQEMVELAVQGHSSGMIASKMGRTARAIRLKLADVAFGKNGFRRYELVDGILPSYLKEHWQRELLKTTPRFRYPPPKQASGCFIATATYGDENHYIVKEFRRFRDDNLLKSKFGYFFVQLYYRISPNLVPLISNSDNLKRFLRKTVFPHLYHKLTKQNETS